MRTASASVLVLVLALVAGSARADETDTTRYYGWEILLADAAAWGLLVTSRSDAQAALGLGIYALAAPAIHAANDEPVHAGLSLGLRLGAPVVGGYLAERNSHSSEDDGIPPAFGGIILGAIAAEVFDAAVLGWHTERHLHAGYAPARGGGGVFSLSGAF